MRIGLVLVVSLALALVGCSGADSTVSYDAGTASVSDGETLRIDFGSINPSVGDSWYLVGEPDSAVLTEIGSETDFECDEPGCGGELTWDFEAVGQGETTLVFQYCFRSGPEDCVGDNQDSAPPEPVELTVEVTG